MLQLIYQHNGRLRRRLLLKDYSAGTHRGLAIRSRLDPMPNPQMAVFLPALFYDMTAAPSGQVFQAARPAIRSGGDRGTPDWQEIAMGAKGEPDATLAC
jgi:hypothetical protein